MGLGKAFINSTQVLIWIDIVVYFIHPIPRQIDILRKILVKKEEEKNATLYIHKYR